MGKKKTVGNYFDVAQEFAVVKFLESDDLVERNRIFNDFLRDPFYTMTESIIKRYKLNRDDMPIEELIDDTLTFLMIKFDKFQPDKNKKAYSYYQTIIKNYLVGEKKLATKQRNRKIFYDDVASSIEEDVKYSYRIDEEPQIEVFDFIGVIIEEIRKEIEHPKIKPNEVKVGYALIDILTNWESLINRDNKSNILAKNKILYEIREYTFLNPKEVASALKRFKKLYKVLKDKNFD